MCIISFYQHRNHNFKNETLKIQPIIKFCCNIFHRNSFCLQVTNKDLYITYNIDKRITILLNFILFSLYTLYFTYWDSFNSISFQLNTCLHTFYMQGCIETTCSILHIVILNNFLLNNYHYYIIYFFLFTSFCIRILCFCLMAKVVVGLRYNLTMHIYMYCTLINSSVHVL